MSAPISITAGRVVRRYTFTSKPAQHRHVAYTRKPRLPVFQIRCRLSDALLCSTAMHLKRAMDEQKRHGSTAVLVFVGTH